MISDDDVFLTSSQVRKRYGGKSRMWLYRTLRDHVDFPKPTPMGGGRYWRLADLLAYERRCAAGSAR